MVSNMRIGITFTKEQGKRFAALSELDNKKPATLAAEIIRSYMDARANDIDSVLRMKAEYEESIVRLRNTNTADKSPVH